MKMDIDLDLVDLRSAYVKYCQQRACLRLRLVYAWSDLCQQRTKTKGGRNTASGELMRNLIMNFVKGII